MSYDASGSAELNTVIGTRSAGYKDTTSNTYDLAGSLWTSTVRHEVATSGLGHPRPYYTRVRTWSRYGSNLQLMATETLFDTVDAVGVYPPVTYYEREEYRYDALGRRIWRRLIRPSLCSKMNHSSGCLSVVERTVWDGDQVLWDIRADGGDGTSAADMEVDATGVRSKPSLEGRVFYTHGPGIDHPLSIGRLDANATVIVPEYDYKGNAISGYCTAGTLCTQLQWPEQLASPWDQDPPPVDGPTVWGGGLIDTYKDGSGYVYMRNRYYDPSSGRFTQEDPIGLAGGLNAYGFAGGDPVNFSDPFGLCPPEDQETGPQCRVYAFGVTLNAILIAGFTVGAGHYSTAQGSGWYFRVGGGTGFDASIGVDATMSDNLAAFSGDGEGTCAGINAGNGCRSTNASGKTYSAGLAFGPSEMVASGHAEKGTTIISKPEPDIPVKRCDTPENERAACTH
ncbi:MAG: RHS repeat-associated core domain-containing protein [Gemmatimonadaceae bacterium]